MLLELAHQMINLSFLYLTNKQFFFNICGGETFFYIIIFLHNNHGILAPITYFCFVLIDLINGYKKIIVIFVWGFLRRFLYKIIFSVKRFMWGFLSINAFKTFF